MEKRGRSFEGRPRFSIFGIIVYFKKHGIYLGALTPFKSIADAQAMDRQYDGSWGIDLVGYGRLAAVAKDGQG